MGDKTPTETTGREIKLQFGGTAKLDRVITVGMPRSLPELQHMAAQHFGHSGCLRLFHHGTSLIYSPAQMGQIQDGDIIIVRKRECFRPSTGDTPLSTHQAEFVKRPFQRPATGSGSDYDSSLADGTKGERLESMSRYAIDFIRHPIEPQKPFKPPSALHLTNDNLGTTTYASEFLWREISQRKALVDDKAVRESSLSLASKAACFEGSSSYTIDYIRPATSGGERATLPPPPIKDNPVPFSAVSTYASDYLKLGRGLQRNAKPKEAHERLNTPFLGTSEYRREYHKLPMDTTDRSEFVKLASEAFQSVTAAELREAVEAATRDGVAVEVELPVGADVRFEVRA